MSVSALVMAVPFARPPVDFPRPNRPTGGTGLHRGYKTDCLRKSRRVQERAGRCARYAHGAGVRQGFKSRRVEPSTGIRPRWSFMGPFETIELNAPAGIADYCRRYGASLSALSTADPAIYEGDN